MAAFTSIHDGMWTDQATWRTNKVSLDLGVWSLSTVSILKDQIPSPYDPESNTAAKIMEVTGGLVAHFCSYAPTLTDNARVRAVVWYKAAERGWCFIACTGKDLPGNTPRIAYFDLVNGVVGNRAIFPSTSAEPEITSSITPVGTAGWYRCEASFPVKTGVSGSIYLGPANGDNGAAYVGDATKGVYVWGPTVWEDIIVNGGFDADSIWVKNGSWTIGSGVATYNGTSGNTLTQNPPLVVGRNYRVTYTVTSYTSGSIAPYCGSAGIGTWRSTSGTFTDTLTCSGDTVFRMSTTGTNPNLSIDNVVVEDLSFYPYVTLDTYTIATGCTVHYDAYNTYELGNGTINGVFKASRSKSTLLTHGNTEPTVNATGYMDWGSQTDPISSSFLAEFYCNPTSDNVRGITVNAGGRLSIWDDPSFYGNDYDTNTYATWSSGRDVTINGDFTNKWGFKVIGNEVVTNQTFNDATWAGSNPNKTLTGWAFGGTDSNNYFTNTVQANALSLVGPSATYPIAWSTDTVTIGRMYQLSFDVVAISGTMWAGSTSNWEYPNGSQITTTGSKKIYLIANTVTIGFGRVSVGATFTIDNVSIKEVSPVELLGPELITNGIFADSTWTGSDPNKTVTGWTKSFTSDANNYITNTGYANQCYMSFNGGANRAIYQTILTVGKLYKYSVDLVSISTGVLRILEGGATPYTHDYTTAGTKIGYFIATSTTFNIQCNNSVMNVVIDNVSVKEVVAGREIVIHKNALYASYVTDVIRQSINSMSYDGTKTTITIGEASPSVTVNQGAVVLFPTRNVITGKLGASRAVSAMNTNRTRLNTPTSASVGTPETNLQIGGMMVGYYTSISSSTFYFAVVSPSLVIRNGLQGFCNYYPRLANTVYGGIYLWLTYGITSIHQFNFCFDGLYMVGVTYPMQYSYAGTFKNCTFLSCYFVGSNTASWKFENCILNGNTYPMIAGSGVVFEACKIYNSYSVSPNFQAKFQNCYIGYDASGVYKRNTFDISFVGIGDDNITNSVAPVLFKNCKLPPPSSLYFNGRNNYSYGNIKTAFANYDNNYNAHMCMGTFGDIKRYNGDVILNGDFSNDIDSQWSLGPGWSISGGKANLVSVGAGNNLSQNNVFEIGKYYTFTITVSDYVQGTVDIYCGGMSAYRLNSAGTFTFTIRCLGSTNFHAQSGTTSILSIDNISAVEDGIIPNGTDTITKVYNLQTNLLPFNGIQCLGSWTENNVPATQQTRSVKMRCDMPQLMTDPSLEIWGSTTDLTNFNETVAGSSTVTRESIQKTSGTYSAKITVDANNNNAYFGSSNQALTLVQGLTYNFSAKIKGPVGKRIWVNFMTTGATYYLDFNGNWIPSDPFITLPDNSYLCDGSWQTISINFTPHPSYNSGYYMAIGHTTTITGNNNQVFYADDVSVQQVSPITSDASELYFEAEYLTGNGVSSTTIASSSVLTDSTNWVDFPVTFTPSVVGPVRYKVWLKKYHANANVYIDDRLYRGELKPLKTVWLDGESQLVADYTSELKNSEDKYSLRGRRMYG